MYDINCYINHHVLFHSYMRVSMMSIALFLAPFYECIYDDTLKFILWFVMC